MIAGLKAVVSEDLFEAVKVVRECCGATGISFMSGIPFIMEVVSPFMTLEGDGVVMGMQTARFLLKEAANIFKGKQPNQVVAYLSELKSLKAPGNFTVSDLKNPQLGLQLLKLSALLRLAKYA